jgi:hypothetical protein
MELTAARWPPAVALAGLLAFAALAPERYGKLPHWMVIALWTLVLVLLAFAFFAHGHALIRRIEALITWSLVGVATVGEGFALARLIGWVFSHGAEVVGLQLLLTGVVLWSTNVVVFGLWYWLLDRGGPDRRVCALPGRRDLLFPQDTSTPEDGWIPGYFDYVFVAFTTSVAFSPTDTLPLTQRAKLLMMLQAMYSVITVLIVVARSVNLVG